MDRISLDRREWLYRFIVYLAGFFLFWEWLRPLEQITDTESVTIFIVYAAFCFFLSFLQLPWYLSIPLKSVGLAFILDGLFMPQRFFSKSWFGYFFEHMQYNVQVMLDYQWWEMTPLFRSLLFLLLLWLMSYLLYYWFVVSKRINFFVILTFIYLTVLDTFTVYDGKVAIIRAFLISLLVMGLSSFIKELDRESIQLKGKRAYQAWLLPLLVLVFSSTVIGYAAPKQTPQWPDPVPFIKSAANNVGGSGDKVQKVGYGMNDSKLGGSFVQDDTPVFQAAAQDKHYWRIETKDTYTGKGWVNSDDANVKEFSSQSELPVDTFSLENVKTEERTATIALRDNATFSKVVYPYGIQKVTQSDATSFEVNLKTGVIQPFNNGKSIQLGEYKVVYNNPSYSFQQLREASGEDPQYIEQSYKQLPDSLPERVVNLSEEIVAEEDNRYDKARAIEQYFSNNGFDYDTQDVAVPGEKEDYVAQFLFDTQQGYCDNFSSSMVVMLRAVGIPARWAKGFTGGEEIDSITKDDTDYNVYEVTSGNAHSWVEVYFPNVGWVPFEPTKGFGNHTDFYLEETEEEDDSEVQQNLEEKLNEQQPEKPEINQEDLNPGSSSNAGKSVFSRVTFWIGMGVLAVISVVLYIYRYHWLMYIYKRRFQRDPNKENYEAAYHFLLKALDDKSGMTRTSGQTLREFSKEIDRHFQSNEMGILTHHYERLLYRNDTENQPWDKVTELWENLIKKALS
ncbi:peptidase [Pontibacillus yanchengensis]|uniref:Peptidase n=1 Tax=Pontibacillus yanchengensis TaxID=462910 RepID=A0ACC7VL48_9BACI|nr:transglutaminaseTgpA domain-containing protein [Pontibacillus yanchengensis]MYL55503.1 peptidase [Pontibacillus yanchengensis]